ncbi:MAG: hypothetical protein RMH84_02740 [Sulfolobales archaeon]|nr:hypothetical protein [Sulfolobales archaeon]
MPRKERLQMEGLPPPPKLFEELVRGWSGFALTGEEVGGPADELERRARPVSPKSYVAQNPFNCRLAVVSGRTLECLKLYLG